MNRNGCKFDWMTECLSIEALAQMGLKGIVAVAVHGPPTSFKMQACLPKPSHRRVQDCMVDWIEYLTREHINT